MTYELSEALNDHMRTPICVYMTTSKCAEALFGNVLAHRGNERRLVSSQSRCTTASKYTDMFHDVVQECGAHCMTTRKYEKMLHDDVRMRRAVARRLAGSQYVVRPRASARKFCMTMCKPTRIPGRRLTNTQSAVHDDMQVRKTYLSQRHFAFSACIDVRECATAE